MQGALEGIKVLDLARVVAGPMCTMLLADLGADVIKVERPGAGDDTRCWGPPWAGTESAYYLSLNRNKRSITVDFKTERGKEIIRRLAGEVDVLIENYKAGTLDRLGLGFEDLAKVNPRLIYCSITGYGLDGPDRDLPGYDFVVQGRGGIMSITGTADGPPTAVGVPIVDVTAAQNAAISILAALWARQRTGKGQLCEIALLDSQVSWLINMASNYLIGGTNPGRMGNHHASIAPYGSFKAQDEWFNVAVGNDGQFGKLCAALGDPDLAVNPLFATNPLRVENRDALTAELHKFLKERPAREWVALLRGENVPCGLINTISEVFDDPQVKSRGLAVEMAHPSCGPIRVVASPLRLHDAPVTYRRHPPLLGEHTEEVLAEQGYSAHEIATMREEGVI
jgi:formyl-CoA transferase